MIRGLDIVAIKMLTGDRLKYIGLVAGLFFASLLVVQQSSIFHGYASRTESWIRDLSGVDLWVMDPQVEFSDDIKPMAQTKLGRVRGVTGVDWAVPMFKSYLKTRLPDGSLMNVRVIGLDDASLLGGPLQMVQGSLANLRQDRAVIVNHADVNDQLRLRKGEDGQPRPLRPGDRLTISDHDMKVVGVFRSTTEFFWDPVVYTTFTRALSIAPPERKLTMFLLVKVKPGLDPAEVGRRIAAETGLQVHTPDSFAQMTKMWVLKKTGILINFGITIALGFIIGVLVAGQTLYTFIVDNLRQFGALKAMGASNAMVVRMVVIQILVAGFIGYGLGLGCAACTGLAFGSIGMAFKMVWQIPVIGAVAILLCCLVAGWISIRRVLKL